MLSLKVQKRDLNSDLAKMRKEGSMPAVFYGKKEASTPITMSQVEFMKAWKHAGESTVVTLNLDGESVDALIHQVDFHPISSMPLHADFYVFDKNKKITIDVPLEYVGVASGVKDFGGLLVKVLHEIKIEALPSNLPHQIDVDISPLTAIGSQILVKDLVLPTGVSLIENGEDVVALVSAPKEDEPEESAPVDLSAIEVVKKGKEDSAEGDAGGEEAK